MTQTQNEQYLQRMLRELASVAPYNAFELEQAADKLCSHPDFPEGRKVNINASMVVDVLRGAIAIARYQCRALGEVVREQQALLHGAKS